MRRAVFTIVSRNYLHYARTLMRSVAEHLPGWQRYVLLVDAEAGVDPAEEPFELIRIAELGLPCPQQFLFRYTILEANTAVKPWGFAWLFEGAGFDQVLYVDPDIRFYRRPDSISRHLEAGAMMVLTPHLSAPLDDGPHPDDLDILRSGTYNLGFLGLARGQDLTDFLRWWQRKLEFDCVVDLKRGLFVDQKWMDLAPTLFREVVIERDPGLNVAYWNLAHRRIEPGPEGPLVNGHPLVFFHFSGFDPRNPQPVSKHQNRFSLEQLSAETQRLFGEYADELIANGLEACKAFPYHYGLFADGTPIPEVARRFYRETPQLWAGIGSDPFSAPRDWLLEPVPGLAGGDRPITALMHYCWRSIPEVREPFPELRGAGGQAFVDWFCSDAAAILGIAPQLLPARGEAARAPDEPLEPSEQNQPADARRSALHVDELLGLPDPEFLLRAYQRLLGRLPDSEGYAHYLAELRAGTSQLEVLRRIRWSPEGRQKAPPVAGLARAWLLSEPWRQLRRRLWPASRGQQTAAAGSVAADASSQPAARPPSALLDLPRGCPAQGYYPVSPAEPGLAWIGGGLALRTQPPGERATLRIAGIHHASAFLRAHGSRALRLIVYVDGQPRGEGWLRRGGAFELDIALHGLPEGRAVTLALRCCRTFVPAAIGINDDQRRLGVQLRRLGWAEEPALLDFSRPVPYQPDARLKQRQAAPAINLIGYLKSGTGVGQGARLAAAAADRVGIATALVEFELTDLDSRTENGLDDRLGRDNPHPVNLFHVNADQFPLLRPHFGEGFFEGRYNIGYWAWELPEFPDAYLGAFADVDEVWVPSSFVQQAVSAKSPVPVICMPHPVEFSVPENVSRREFGLPEGQCLFLCMYDLRSYQARKNPRAAVEAFLRAFPQPGLAMLVIKVQSAAACPDDYAELEALVAGRPHLKLIDGRLGREAIYRLEACCDAFVSLHRAEGFGLALAECMLLGKPVIATHWSGNTDFMRPDNSCCVHYGLTRLECDHGVYRAGQYWAEADIEHAAWFMRRIVHEPDWAAELGQRGRRTILEGYSLAAIGARYRRRLEHING